MLRELSVIEKMDYCFDELVDCKQRLDDIGGYAKERDKLDTILGKLENLRWEIAWKCK